MDYALTTLPDSVVTSDLTAWSWKNFIYVTGGFQANYTAVGTTYRLDFSNDPMDFESMQYTELAPSPTPRGDIQAVELYGYAYMAGGITHTNLWCEALKTTERYHMATDTWGTLDNLNVGRADMAVAVLNGKIISIGGEVKPHDCLEVRDPAYGSFPEDQVEVLLDGSWVHFEDFVEERFRFAAAVVPSLNKLYTFGGQVPFDFTCDCFPTSNDGGVGTEVYDAPKQGLRNGSVAAVVLGSFVGLVLVFFIIRKVRVRRQSKALEAGDDSEFQDKEEATSA